MIDKRHKGNLIELRKYLHQHPELSGEEKETQKVILNYLKHVKPNKIIKNIGGFGLAFIFDSKKAGPTLLIRADMDALPIKEINTIEHISKNEGVAHLCGHDGHMTILSGLAERINNELPERGKLVLLFQPAEETGKGAISVIEDEKFKEIYPDYSFGLHNLPGFEKNTVFCKPDAFASASTGVIIKLKGLSSHAAYPEDGNNPDICIAELIKAYNSIPSTNKFDDFVLLTIIHIKLGEVAFGTTPGGAVIMLTIRSFLNKDMDLLKNHIDNITSEICEKFNIDFTIELTEDFPATLNETSCFEIVKETATSKNIKYDLLSNPFRWSEDFGHFSKISKSVFFGIGTGVNHPQLHNENYDFPDEIIEIGIRMFFGIYKKILFTNE